MYVIRLRSILRVLILAAAVLLAAAFCFAFFHRPEAYRSALSAISPEEYLLFLDAGHGGLDGGAVSKNGTEEAGINLAIAQKTQLFLRFLGISGKLTRTDEQSLEYNPDASARENKNRDLNARLSLSKSSPELDFLSIHLNKFEQEKYHGAQVFYSPNTERSAVLAECLQSSLRSVLDPQNDRRIKLAPDSVMLMKNINSPAVTIECGFLSNAQEEELLKTASYQTKIAIAISGGYIQYLEQK